MACPALQRKGPVGAPIRTARAELDVPKGMFSKGARQTIQQLSMRDADRASPRDRVLRASLDSRSSPRGFE